MRLEAKVGIFVVVAIILLFLMSTQINRFNFSQQEAYPVEVAIGNAAGLNPYGKVRINGVEAGYIAKIYLRGKEAYATIMLYYGVMLPTDSVLVLAQENMLGGKYIEIIPGKSEEMIAEGGSLTQILNRATLDETSDSIKKAAEEFQLFVHEFRLLFNEQVRVDLQEAVAHIKETASLSREILTENRENIYSTLQGITEMAASIRQTSDKFAITADEINRKLPVIADKIEVFASGATDMIEENKESLGKTLRSVDGFFTDGRQVVNRLDQYLSVVDKSQLELAMRAEYLLTDGVSKGYASAVYIPSPTRYYIMEAIGAVDYSRADNNGALIEPKRSDKDKLYFSLQLGKRYGSVLFRGGLIESSAGVGMDYYLLDDKMRASIEVFDFTGKRDLRGDLPHLKLTLRYTLLKYIDFFAGLDNPLNKDTINLFVGAGVRFIDDDAKSLIGTIGGAAGMAK
ncbi:hypothetical protein CCZ01_01140 [Helicobacter monodelphidis]|uniref:MlaD family protein n=1 Tax=Helicobacter sp. 15-1451 TaxID=2004995 RepID=UPI000DCEB1C0|nr:MlaD family protein [Helicobacter sp. 15-1451]RAX58829.1 hypothetical protein CCZ01_01140 [Helicobacter sp. 15-1451]